MSALDSLSEERLWLGCLLAGTWLNLVFCTGEFLLFAYFMPQWKLKHVYQYGAYLLILNDVIGSVAVCVNFYDTVVDRVPQSETAIVVLLITTAISAVMEQSFLLHRYYTISRNRFTISFISLLVVAHFAMTLVCSTLGPARDQTFTPKLAASTLASIFCAVADVFVSCSIIWTLSGLNTMWRSTQHIVRVLCLNALTSGAVVATVTVLAGITAVVKGVDSIIFSIFFASMGRVYSLTILVNIIVRNSQRHIVNSAPMGTEPATATSIHFTHTSGPNYFSSRTPTRTRTHTHDDGEEHELEIRWEGANLTDPASPASASEIESRSEPSSSSSSSHEPEPTPSGSGPGSSHSRRISIPTSISIPGPSRARPRFTYAYPHSPGGSNRDSTSSSE
ncbi:hypothetical protein FB45DRAFT_281174 [Roridomyces roridus]|uniref:Uncharacterized protein n=1 Tax=Roridomyces roridus TaxID=1738132 RepID=A0AAD7CCE4_9AGAR|nr:hypothetical protein FB45DRAFT_281174 [Roridomyces roridus]